MTFDLNRGAGHGFIGEKEGVKTGTIAGLAGVCKCIASKLGGGRWAVVVIGVMRMQLVVGYGI